MKKIIFFDLDGTLLNDKKEILEESKIAIQKAKENGIQIVLCSGRQKSIVNPYRELADTGRYIICSNGAEIYDCVEKESLFLCEIEKDICFYLYNLAIEKDFLIRCDTPYGRYINDMKYYWLNEIELTENIEDFLYENKILQLTIGAPNEKAINEIIELLKENRNVKIENKYCSHLNGQEMWLINVINTSVSKGNGIFGLCKYLKIDIKDSVGFGDDLNDLSMMKTVGFGVAMGNAHPEIKKLAQKVIGNNNESSIAKYIDEIIEENRN